MIRRLNTSNVLLLAAITLCGAAQAQASATCSTVLTADQLRELDVMVSPAHPYSAHLRDAIDGDPAQGTVRRMARAEIEKLRGAITHPFVGPVRDVRSEDRVAALKAWLNAKPSAQFPAWDTTAGERDTPSPWAWVPGAWIGRTAENFLHLIQESGNAGPIKATTLGAAASRGHELGVTEHIAIDASGHDTFVWSYIYRATVGGRPITTLLAICEADVVAISDDERDLRAVEQQLARAWATRDRATLERILAREWSMTMADGTTVSRAALMGAVFDSNTRIVEAMSTDDDGVTVTRFDGAAVVRGRTIETVVLSGTRQTSTVGFTDVFIKRTGSWQVVASHQTGVMR